MLAHDFVRNAYLAGTAIGLGCGIIGWFVVLRGQLFAGDALSHVAFVGAIAAAVLGLDERVGLFVLTVAMAGGMAALGPRSQAGDTVIGLMFAWILGVGLLLLSLLATSSAGASGISAANTLFGSIYSLGAGASRVAALIAVAVAVAILLAHRPLLLASLDAELAAVRGVPVRALGAGFLIALALLTADGTQAIGALLLLGLLSAPAGAAHRLTADPRRGVALSALLAVGCVWGGLAISYAVGSIPPSSAIIGLAGAAYALAALSDGVRVRRRRRVPGQPGVRLAVDRSGSGPGGP
jgi:zinc/manganese transport system permease protein